MPLLRALSPVQQGIKVTEKCRSDQGVMTKIAMEDQVQRGRGEEHDRFCVCSALPHHCLAALCATIFQVN